MEFEFTDTFYVNEVDLEEMCDWCKKGYTPQEALNIVSSDWDDPDFYAVGYVEEQIIAEINRRLNKGCD
jgi:hypothetical protein